MWIVLGIFLFFATVITIVLMLNVFIIIKTNENGDFCILYKFMGKTFGGQEPSNNNPIVEALKRTTGVSEIETFSLKKNIKEKGLATTISSTYNILISILKEIKDILKFCTAKKLNVDIICTGENAADAAINYGKCCSATYPFLGMVNSLITVKPNCEKINISCDYNNQNCSFNYNIMLSVRLCHLLAALIRIAYKEARRTLK